MARKINIPNHIKRRLIRDDITRKENGRQLRKQYLIICEGEKTEPNYFIALRDSLPKGVLNVCDFHIDGTGYNTQSLVNRAIEIKDEWQRRYRRPVDKLWIVFDRDSFRSQSFNAAIQRCNNLAPEVNAAWTNEAFELWFLLHFHYYNTSIDRANYQQLIEANFRGKGIDNFEYKKNSIEMYSLLSKHGSQSDAIRNSKRLTNTWNRRVDFANLNPCTTVHKLIEEILSLA
jgi:RloB-like protein